MANNERVSQLPELFASDLQPDDILLATDTSQKESKKIEIGQLLLFIESSGSFFTYNATYAKTASYIKGYNVDGYVYTALNASHSVSASWADRAGSSSYALTSSWARYALTTGTGNTNADTASFLKYVGTPNGTASYAMGAFITDISSTASFLQYIPGASNGTSSYSISSSVSISSSFSNISVSASYATNSFSSVSSSWASSSIFSNFASSSVSSSWSSASISSSYALTASCLVGSIYQPIKAWAMITWSSLPASPSIVMNYNISSLTLVSRYTVGAYYWDQFAVTFTTPLQNTNYTLIGNGTQPHGAYNSPSVVIHPVYGNRTVLSFTMSIFNTTAMNFYDWTVSAPPNDRYGCVSFEILGL